MAAAPGQQLGRYEIRSLIGHGATSTVYLAWDPFAQREVAIKQLRSDVLRDPVRGRLFRQLFLNEAAFAGRLHHPHIVAIHDAAVDSDNAYMVMDYVPGGTLEKLTQPGRLAPFPRVIEIIFKATRALDYAFHQGITHRDIKPGNILLVTPDGSDIRVSDFGAALHTARETTQISGVGSPAYMSPQQVREVPLDHRTDIYSLGVVMFQLLTGHLPFETDSDYGLLYRIANDDPPLPSELRPDVPAALDAIVRRATARDIDERYQNWDEFSHDLAKALHEDGLNLHDGAPGDAEKFEALRSMLFFHEFSDAELWEVIGLASFRRVAPDTVLIREGDSGEAFHFIIEGEAEVRKRGRLLNRLGAGDCFGEIAVFSSAAGVRTASVLSTSALELITIRAHALRRASNLCRMHFYKAFLEVLATRLSLASARIVDQKP